MVQLEEATRRLQSAVDRLDQAVLARTERDERDQSGEGRSGVDELRAALERKSQENERLQTVATEAGERIESALGRLNTLLGE